MREIEEITKSIYKITAEPGDCTRYEYLVYRDGPDNFTFAPTRSTFRFPQRLNIFAERSNENEQRIAEQEQCNVFTVRECLNCISDISFR